MFAACVAAQIVSAALVAPFYSRFGLSIAWGTAWPLAATIGALLPVALVYQGFQSGAADAAAADTIAVIVLMLVLFVIAGPAQYVAVSLHRPLIDARLAAMDEALGIRIPALVEWTATRPVLLRLLALAYNSFVPQLVGAVVVLGLALRDRGRLWEFCFHFHFCLIATLVVFALFPSDVVCRHYGCVADLDQTRFVAHFTALRDGTFHELRFGQLEGLVSMPSFHALGALMVTWALRRRRGLTAAVAALNFALVMATFMTGVHYFVDVLGALVVFGVSLAVYSAVF